VDASDEGFCGRLFFGSCFSIPRSTPLNFFVSGKGSNAVFLADKILVLNIEPLPTPALDRVGKFDVKIVDIWANAYDNATYVVGDIF
jgi:hypothetical protein